MCKRLVSGYYVWFLWKMSQECQRNIHITIDVHCSLVTQSCALLYHENHQLDEGKELVVALVQLPRGYPPLHLYMGLIAFVSHPFMVWANIPDMLLAILYLCVMETFVQPIKICIDCFITDEMLMLLRCCLFSVFYEIGFCVMIEEHIDLALMTNSQRKTPEYTNVDHRGISFVWVISILLQVTKDLNLLYKLPRPSTTRLWGCLPQSWRFKIFGQDAL